MFIVNNNYNVGKELSITWLRYFKMIVTYTIKLELINISINIYVSRINHGSKLF